MRAEGRRPSSTRGPAAQTLIDPLVVSWDWLDGAAFHELHRWQGTRDPSAFLAVPAAIDFQAEHDWPAVRAALPRRCSRHASCRLEPLTDDFVQMRGFRVDHPDPAALKRRLYDEHRIEVPIVETPHGWVMRVSVQALQRRGRPGGARAALALQLVELSRRQLSSPLARDAIGGRSRAARDDLGSSVPA